MLVEWEGPVERYKRGKNMLWRAIQTQRIEQCERKQLLYTWRQYEGEQENTGQTGYNV